jgi:antitoxin ParD1/3/4
MSIHSIHIPAELETFVNEKVSSGRYRSASEVVQEALWNLKDAETTDEQKLKALRQALADGEASGIYEGDAFNDVRRELGLPLRHD